MVHPLDCAILSRLPHPAPSWDSTIDKLRTNLNRDMTHDSHFAGRVRAILTAALRRGTANPQSVPDLLRFAGVVINMEFSPGQQLLLRAPTFRIEVFPSSAVESVRLVLGAQSKPLPALVGLINSRDVRALVRYLEGLRLLFDAHIPPSLLLPPVEALEKDMATISMDHSACPLGLPLEDGLLPTLTLFETPAGCCRASIGVRTGSPCRLQTQPTCSRHNSDLRIEPLGELNSCNVDFSFVLSLEEPVILTETNLTRLQSRAESLEAVESGCFLRLLGFDQRNTSIQFDCFAAEIGYKIREIRFVSVEVLVDIIGIVRRQLLFNRLVQNCSGDVGRTVTIRSLTDEQMSLLLVFRDAFTIVNLVMSVPAPLCRVDDEEELSARLTLVLQRYLSIPLLVKALEVAESGEECPPSPRREPTRPVPPKPAEKAKPEDPPRHSKYVSHKTNCEFGIPTYEESFPHCALSSHLRTLRIPGGFSDDPPVPSPPRRVPQESAPSVLREFLKSEDVLKKPRGRPRKKAAEGETLPKRVRRNVERTEVIFENRFSAEMARGVPPWKYGDPFDDGSCPRVDGDFPAQMVPPSLHQEYFVPTASSFAENPPNPNHFCCPAKPIDRLKKENGYRRGECREASGERGGYKVASSECAGSLVSVKAGNDPYWSNLMSDENFPRVTEPYRASVCPKVESGDLEHTSVGKLYNQGFFTCTDLHNFRIPKKQNKKTEQ